MGVAELCQRSEDLWVVRAADLARAGLRVSLDAAESRHPAGVDSDYLPREVEVAEAECHHLGRAPAHAKPHIIEHAVGARDGGEEPRNLRWCKWVRLRPDASSDSAPPAASRLADAASPQGATPVG